MGDQKTGWGWQASHQSCGTQAACAAALPAQHSEEQILDTLQQDLTHPWESKAAEMQMLFEM